MEQSLKLNINDYIIDFKNTNFEPKLWYFSIINPLILSKEYEINDTDFRIARNKHLNDIVIDSKHISRKSLNIILSKGLWFIEEHNENKNGYLNFLMVLL